MHASSYFHWLYPSGENISWNKSCSMLTTCLSTQRVIVLKDQTNKKAHEESAQLACEAAGSIKTVAALTREDDCIRLYGQSLDAPLKNSNRTAIWSAMLFAFSQASMFFVVALVFWYGATLVSRQQATTFEFFIGLMVSSLPVIHSVCLKFFCMPHHL